MAEAAGVFSPGAGGFTLLCVAEVSLDGTQWVAAALSVTTANPAEPPQAGTGAVHGAFLRLRYHFSLSAAAVGAVCIDALVLLDHA